MVLTGKLKAPEIKGHIVQKQAVSDAVSSQECRCVIVSAAGGCGKTTLFAGAVAKEDLWYTLDGSDADPGRFLENLEYLWNRADGKSAGKEKDPYDRISALIGRAGVWETRRILVLDDLQEIAGTESMRLLLLLCTYAGENLRLILLTREIPEGFQKQLLQGKAILITEKKLSLTPEEVKSWLSASGLPDGEPDRLTAGLGGWAAGIATAARCAPRGGSDWQTLLAASGLAAYLDELFWEPLDTAERAFFAQTAALETFSWELCRELLRPQPSRADFERLTQCAAFLLVKDQEGKYAYGAAFGCYLLGKLTDAQKEEIAFRAAGWYQEKGDINRMIAFAVSGKQNGLLTEALEHDGERLLRELNAETFRVFAEYLERAALVPSPEAAGVLAQLFYREGQYNRMEDYLNIADSAFGKENKYSCYRSLYRALQRMDEDAPKYEKQINNALFFLKEEKEKLPYLPPEDQKRLEELLGKERAESHAGLSARTFGTFRVMVREDGHELTWRTKKGRELFAYLLTIGGRAVERRELIGTLWQEEIPDHAVAMLHNMIYNIRKELSAYCLEGLLVYENKRYYLKTDEILCDKGEIPQIARRVEKGDAQALKADFGKLENYWGAYLEDIDGLWAEQKRRYYDEMYMKGCFLLARCYMEEGNYERAQKLCQNILLLDPYSEQAEELLLISYGRQKKWERVKACYQEFSGRLKKELNVYPGKEVAAAYHQYFR